MHCHATEEIVERLEHAFLTRNHEVFPVHLRLAVRRVVGYEDGSQVLVEKFPRVHRRDALRELFLRLAEHLDRYLFEFRP